MNRNSIARSIVVAVIAQAPASSQTHPDLVSVDLCKVVASPTKYDGKMLSLKGILLAGEHSVLLYSTSCQPKEGLDVGIQAVFPAEWANQPNGKDLRKFLHRGRAASVTVSGTFEGGDRRYGPDTARFRFTISEISSVERAPPGIHP